MKAFSGGGPMMDLAVHCIDLMEYISGMRVTQVASMNEKIAFSEEAYDVEDTSTLLMRMENGAQFVVQTNFNIPDEAAKWRVEFFGTKGRLLGDTMIGQNDMGKLNAVFIDRNVAYSATQNHADDVGIDIPGDFGNLYTREVESFCNSILNGLPLEVPASDAVHVQRIMEAAYRSGKEMKIFEV
jgi:predicted dehydrogenase